MEYNMKLCFTALFLLFAISRSALSYEAPGMIFFKKDNNIMKKSVSLSIPKNPEGSVKITCENGRVIESKVFDKKKVFGALRFSVVFDKSETEALSEIFKTDAEKIIFTGTVLMGKNLVMYYGDIFTTDSSDSLDLTTMLDDNDLSVQQQGGFVFKKPQALP
tara:strand:+ start:786 stop:1271 length:486 start_codon:yes stop_codon:yes gene_type:complete